jgi:hypothetical protein
LYIFWSELLGIDYYSAINQHIASLINICTILQVAPKTINKNTDCASTGKPLLAISTALLAKIKTGGHTKVKLAAIKSCHPDAALWLAQHQWLLLNLTRVFQVPIWGVIS